ncbi:hypothetical protein LTR53_000049 [Teratosphaeriaceae sp. CCFEE 6253]|nr:hypothetical protein LTR53_000049 [Teratosphaeriaceae sp. CCFEE 6253]
MTGDTRTVLATCLCGAAAHDVPFPTTPSPARFCHCGSCRHAIGTLALGMVEPVKGYRPSQSLVDKLQPYAFSQRVTCYHCPTCGTAMLSREERAGRDPNWMLSTGTLAAFDGVVEVDCHEYLTDTLDGGLSDFLTHVDGKPIDRWPGKPGEGERLPLHWQSPTRPPPNPTPSPADKLRAHCKCNGVEFWLARPSARSAMGQAPWPDVLRPSGNNDDDAADDDDEDDAVSEPDDTAWWLRAAGTKFLASLCACASCRFACGQEWMAWAYVPASDLSLDAAGSVPFTREFGTLKQYRSSEDVTRHFCGTCGATAFWDGDARPFLLDVAVGLLEAGEGARAEGWLEWRVTRLSHREEALGRARRITEGVEEGLAAYGKRVPGEGVVDGQSATPCRASLRLRPPSDDSAPKPSKPE